MGLAEATTDGNGAPAPLPNADGAGPGASGEDVARAITLEAAPEQTHVEVNGEMVALADLPQFADKDCRLRCVDGVRNVGRAVPPNGVRWSREVCTCVVRAHRELAVLPAASAPARGVDAAASAVKVVGPRHIDRSIANLRARVGQLRTERGAVLEAQGRRVSALAGAAGEETGIYERSVQDIMVAETALSEARRALTEAEQRATEARELLAMAEDAVPAARASRDAAWKRARAADAAIDVERRRDADAIARLDHDIEKTERRLNLKMARNPEAAAGADAAP